MVKLMMAQNELIRMKRSPSQLLGTVEGWCPAMAYVVLNPLTRQFEPKHYHVQLPEITMAKDG
jgi:hypothetical protein